MYRAPLIGNGSAAWLAWFAARPCRTRFRHVLCPVFGTDHGSSAPLLLFGPGLHGGGLYDAPPALNDLDEFGNMPFHVDFRTVYGTVLKDWFGFSQTTAETVLLHPFTPLGFIADPAARTAVEPAAVPERFVLHQNYPNPFNPTTTIQYDLPEATAVRLELYDVLGRRVHVLVDRDQPAGTYRLRWDGRDAGGHGVASGLYLSRLVTPAFTQTRTLLLVK